MTDILYNWLFYEWVKSNHSKYLHYFKDWVVNLTPNQIQGFEKMRITNFKL